MPYLLHIDTATTVCSVCLSHDDETPYILYENNDTNGHAAHLTLLIEKVLGELSLKDIDAISVSAGPGSYTGLRIGVSTVKGICYALDKPLIAVDTLTALAQAMHDQFRPNAPTVFVPMLDARRMDAYYGVFDAQQNLLQAIDCYTLTNESFATFVEQGYQVCIGGDAAQKYKQQFGTLEQHFFSPIVQNSAQYLVKLAYQAFLQKQFVDVAYFEPFYLKPPMITVAKEKM